MSHNAQQSSRQAALARRREMSTRGKSGIKTVDRVRGMEQTMPAAAPLQAVAATAPAEPACGCQKEAAAATSQATLRVKSTMKGAKPVVNPTRAAALARRRSQSTRGKASTGGSGVKAAVSARAGKTELTGRELAQVLREQRSQQGAAGMPKTREAARPTRPARNKANAVSDASLKVGVSETSYGQVLTGSMVGRSAKMTDEPSTCRAVTGTQYLGAEIFRSFCQSEPPKSPRKVRVSSTRAGGVVTGNDIGRSKKVTGDEPGTCKNVTGIQYLGSDQFEKFCDASSPARKAEEARMGSVMAAHSHTMGGASVTGTQPGRSQRVTGNEPGTCKSVTGTPYAGLEQLQGYCAEPAVKTVMARNAMPKRSTPGAVLTGIQPGIGGRTTGDQRGACEAITGTPYIGAEQYAEVCPATAAQPASPDYPQTLDAAPWTQFSVQAPVHAAQELGHQSAVTGGYNGTGQITGSFDRAAGKVTGTEEVRYGQQAKQAAPVPATATEVDGRSKSRISGEGMETSVRITGNDWDRGDRVTGTEGRTAAGRNPTRRGQGVAAAPLAQQQKRNETLPEPVSKVTGGSGNTDRGALVTYSGGARG